MIAGNVITHFSSRISKRQKKRFLSLSSLVKVLSNSTLLVFASLVILSVKWSMNVHTDLSAAKQLNDEDQKRIDWKMSADEFIGMYQSDPLLHQSLMVYNYEFPCTKWQSHNEKEQHGGKISSPNGKDGIIFVKVHKAASTTVRNVLYQIAREKGGCYVTGEHVVANNLNLTKRDKTTSYLLTFIRDPTERAISDYYYHIVTRKGEIPTLKNFKESDARMKQLKTRGLGGYQLTYILPEQNFTEYTFWNENEPSLVQNPELLVSQVATVVDNYDFIGVAEKLDESLVVLSFLLNLTVEEISSTMSARVSGSYIDLATEKRCVKIVKPKITMKMKEYFKSMAWKAQIVGDSLLHNLSLERLEYAIDHVIGRQKFEERLVKYNYLIKSFDACRKYCFHCSPYGEYRSAVPKACRKCKKLIKSKWDFAK